MFQKVDYIQVPIFQVRQKAFKKNDVLCLNTFPHVGVHRGFQFTLICFQLIDQLPGLENGSQSLFGQLGWATADNFVSGIDRDGV